MLPQLRAGISVITNNDLVVAMLLLRVQALANHGKRAPAGPDAVTPHLARRMLVPVGRQPHAREAAVTAWTAEARPIACLQRQHFDRGSRRSPLRHGVRGERLGLEAILRAGLPAINNLRLKRAGDTVKAN